MHTEKKSRRASLLMNTLVNEPVNEEEFINRDYNIFMPPVWNFEAGKTDYEKKGKENPIALFHNHLNQKEGEMPATNSTLKQSTNGLEAIAEAIEEHSTKDDPLAHAKSSRFRNSIILPSIQTFQEILEPDVSKINSTFGSGFLHKPKSRLVASEPEISKSTPIFNTFSPPTSLFSSSNSTSSSSSSFASSHQVSDPSSSSSSSSSASKSGPVLTSSASILPKPPASSTTNNPASNIKSNIPALSFEMMKSRISTELTDVPSKVTSRRERNRLAAERSRQKKNTLIQTLQQQVSKLNQANQILSSENIRLKMELEELRSRILLK